MRFLKLINTKFKIESFKIVALSAWVSKVFSAVAQILMIGLLTRILNVDEYAAFVLLISLLGWYNLTDVCLGISVQNAVSEYKSKNISYENLIFNGFLVLFFFLFIFVIILYFMSAYLGETLLGKYDIIDNRKILFFISGTFMIANTIFSSVYKLWYALSKGYFSNIVPVIATMITLLSIYIFSRFTILENNLFIVILIYFLPLFLLSGLFFFKKFFFETRNYYKIDIKILKFLVKRAWHFFIFGFMAAIVLQVDYLICSRYLVSEELIKYSFLSRIFSLGFFIYNAFLLALWPVISGMIVKNNWRLVVNYIRKFLPLGLLIISVFTVVLVIFMPYIAPLLIKNATINISINLILIFGLYYIIRVWADTFAMILQSMSDMKPFWIIVPVQAIFSVIFQIFFVKQFGIYGILIGLILSFVLSVCWFLPMRVLEHYKKFKQIEFSYGED